jgi:predicted ATP-grasp superfamily ATP-dependent carboligase
MPLPGQRIQISHIKGIGTKTLRDAINDFKDISRLAQFGLQRQVFITLALFGMDNNAVFDIDNRNNVHGVQFAGIIRDGKVCVMANFKILIFEYITGGGFNKSELPDSLAREGLLMLTSLINDLTEMDYVDFLVMVDKRMIGLVDLPSNQQFLIGSDQDCWQEYQRLMLACDAVWPIAPESGGILHKICEAVERSGKILLNSPPSAVALAGNKWLTYQHLQLHEIATVYTEQLTSFNFTSGDWIIKPVDGVGCEDSHFLSSFEDFSRITQRLGLNQYIIQPHLTGQKTSLSCLFKQGKGWLVCVNLQHFVFDEKRYRLTGIDVNVIPQTFNYKVLVEKIAQSMPDLWGYVGIDLIETSHEMLVLEINPRLTSSYSGIKNSCGINCANEVLNLLTGEPKLAHIFNEPTRIELAVEGKHAE